MVTDSLVNNHGVETGLTLDVDIIWLKSVKIIPFYILKAGNYSLSLFLNTENIEFFIDVLAKLSSKYSSLSQRKLQYLGKRRKLQELCTSTPSDPGSEMIQDQCGS